MAWSRHALGAGVRDDVSVPVWDLPTRAFHWALVVAVIVSYVTGDAGQGLFFAVHILSGYLVLLLLVFRLIWGFVGSPRSRFSDFVRRRRDVLAYLGRLVRLDPPTFVGHNPLGGWMVVLMLAVLALTVTTGLFSGSDDGGAGILLSLVAAQGSEGLAEIHEIMADMVIWLAVLHVVGVLVDWLVTGENLVRAMIDGRKTLDAAAAAAEPRLAGPWRAAAVAAMIAVVGLVLVRATDFEAAVRERRHAEPEAPERTDDRLPAAAGGQPAKRSMMAPKAMTAPRPISLRRSDCRTDRAT